MAKKLKKTEKGIEISGLEAIPGMESLPTNVGVSTKFVEIVNFYMRSDGVGQLRFFSRAPGVNIEECRLVMTKEGFMRTVDLLARNLGYYPIPEEAREETSDSETKKEEKTETKKKETESETKKGKAKSESTKKSKKKKKS